MTEFSFLSIIIFWYKFWFLFCYYLLNLPLICFKSLQHQLRFPNTLVWFLSLLHPNSLTIIHTNYFSSGAWLMLDEMISQDDMITQALYCDRLDGPFKPKLRSRWHCTSSALLLWYSNPYYPADFCNGSENRVWTQTGSVPVGLTMRTPYHLEDDWDDAIGGDEWQWYWYIVIIC